MLAPLVLSLLLYPQAELRPADRAKSLFDSAWSRMDGYVQHFRRTGDTKSRLLDLEVAAGQFAESARLYLASGGSGDAAMALVRQADCRRMQQRWNDALSIYDAAMRVAMEAGNAGYQAKALIGIARIESQQERNYDAALQRLNQAIRLSAGLPDRSFYLDALEELADVERLRGAVPAAVAGLNRALDLAKSLKDEPRMIYLLYSRGSAYLQMAFACAPSRHKDSTLCREVIDLAAADLAAGQRLANQLGYNGLARQMNADGSLKTLRMIVDSLERTSTALAKHRVFEPEIPSDVLVSEMFVPSGEPEDQSCQQARLLSASVYTGLEDPRSLHGQGEVELICGRADAALGRFRKAVDQLEKDRRNVADESGRGTFLENKTAFYELPAAVLLQRHEYAEAFNLLERSRSSVLADLLASRTIGLSDPVERKLYADATKLRAEIALEQKNVFELSSAPDRDQRVSEIAARQAKLAALEAGYQRLMDQIGSQAPRLRELTASQPVTLDHLQRILGSARLEVLYYLVRQDDVILLHISPGVVHARVVFVPRPTLIQKVDELRESLKVGHAEFSVQRAHQLFLLLVQPATGWLKSDNLVIVPHGVLHYVPFQVLFDKAEGRFAGERFRISYAPSATILAGLRSIDNLAGGNLFAAVGPDLAARTEVEAIARSYPGRSRVLDGDLTETAAKRLTRGAQVVHLAAHGLFNAREPLLSALKLAKSAEDDGTLTAAEMFGLPLDQASLVTLSACETGRVQATAANEIVGMVRALLYAGAQSLLVSSWKVDSAATSLWMRTFYAEAQRNPPREAARLALLAVKNHAGYSHPFYWGPFLLVGR